MFNPTQDLKKLPARSGCYMFFNNQDEIIYVGKAINLKNRVRSYFAESQLQISKIRNLRMASVRFEYIVTDTEVEALILECNLIKEYQPKYNILLKDDKSYPYIKLTINEDFPRVFATRNYEDDGSKYFGPYTSSFAVTQTLEQILKLWPLRRTNKKITDGTPTGRPCLNYHIGLCPGPCGVFIRKNEYKIRVDAILEFLNGKHDEIIKQLKKDMLQASESLNYEEAASHRDKINAIKRLQENQKLDKISSGDQDIIALALNNHEALAQVFFIRDGKMTGREHFMIEGIQELAPKSIMASFITQFYSGTPFIPKELVLQCDIEDSEIIHEWLKKEKGQKVNITIPQKGEKLKLVKLAENNAIITLHQFGEHIKKEEKRTIGALQELQNALNLQNINRIEAYDISNIQGFENVGSMVAYEGGRAKRSDYRKFKIKSMGLPNDYASMKDMLYRRFRRYEKEQTQNLTQTQQKFSRLPDLILIDGGTGHIAAAKEVLSKLNISIPIAGMVKDEKHRTRGLLYESIEVSLPLTSEGFKLIARIQEEVHRFAIEYHRKLRQKTQVHSALDDIKGIGNLRRQALLRHFGTIENIKKANIQELCKPSGMNTKSAAAVYNFFRGI